MSSRLDVPLEQLIVADIRAHVAAHLRARARRRMQLRIFGWFLAMVVAPTIGACLCFGAAWLLGWK